MFHVQTIPRVSFNAAFSSLRWEKPWFLGTTLLFLQLTVAGVTFFPPTLADLSISASLSTTICHQRTTHRDPHITGNLGPPLKFRPKISRGSCGNYTRTRNSYWHFVKCHHDESTDDNVNDDQCRGSPVQNKCAPPAFETKNILPDNVIPIHYTLHIRPILEKPGPGETPFTAPGQVQIDLHSKYATNQVTLHRSADLVIDTQSITIFHLRKGGHRGSQLDLIGITCDPTRDFLTIKLTTSLSPGQNYKLSINFTSQVNQRLAGLFRGQYTTVDGETRHMVVTHFQKYGAKMAFPCFDEPALKATFDISIGRRKELKSFSNMDSTAIGVKDRSLPSGWVWDVYSRTKTMSTYLVAFIVSDFVCENAEPSLYRLPTRVCGPAHRIVGKKGATYPAMASAKLMKYFEHKLSYPFEMPKLDAIAVPAKYLRPYAMENWGLVTYRDNLILTDDEQSTESHKSFVWAVMAHELAHQWFGNLLTCADWAQVWLNEGLTSFMESKYSEVATEFDSVREIVPKRMQDALEYDVGRQDPVHNSTGLGSNKLFYDKGSALAHMLEGFLGQQTLFKAFATYLHQNAYKPVTHDELFDVLNLHAHKQGKIPGDKTMGQIMNTWVHQPGYPLVKVRKIEADNTIHIFQQKYLPSKEDCGDVLWEIPIAIATEDNPSFSNHTPALWLNTRAKDWKLPFPSRWIILNTDAMAFFRVHYDDRLLAQIHNLLKKKGEVLSPQTRSQLVDDYFSFANLGHVPFGDALEFTKYLDHEKDNIVWLSVFRHVDYMMDMLDKSWEIKAYFLSKFEPVLSHTLTTNWTLPVNGVGSRVIWISKMLDRACSINSEPCRSLALTLFKMWMKDGDVKLNKLIPPDFQPTILCHGVSQLGSHGHDFLVAQYNKADPNRPQKDRFLTALSCSDNVQSFVSKNLKDVTPILSHMARTPRHRSFVMDILRDHAPLIIEAQNEEAVADTVKVLGNYYKSQQELDKLTVLVERLKTILTCQSKAVVGVLDKVQSNMKWIAKNAEPIISWIKNNIKTTNSRRQLHNTNGLQITERKMISL